MIKRTPQIRALMVHAIQLAIDLLEHPSTPKLSGSPATPKDLALCLYAAQRLINSPGSLHRKKELLIYLQEAADYLSHGIVTAHLHTVVRPSMAAANLRAIIRDLI